MIDNPFIPGARVWYNVPLTNGKRLAATIVEINPNRHTATLLVHDQRDGLPVRPGTYEVYPVLIDTLEVRK